ncbi:sigma-70 family RNA polymerase sigma factor [Billgrantia kenyensis]|uniref:Sigma-70 family RNA polymerase sigma factor n=1 Tax=Billgrantia kenyensis TaxID=321266 RepID=A0A7V9VZN4_9GAMM|nr:sigma-70 family RNA polymerase sigma factor [Halomonas kenyensis]MBA2778364.1 sigma-70 family RNA polymerase sigma factor [Halomonas kenyensis]MCG6660670.1 sigma-70 family RNA polymerase sigma factor [Halomonas kenyensis]
MRRLSAVRPRLLSFARLHLRNHATAEDAVQDALEAAIEKSDSFSGHSSYETWVFGILKHKILDIMRTQKRLGQWQPLEDENDDDAIDRQFQQSGQWQREARPVSWGEPEAVFENERFWQVFDACMIVLPDTLARVFSLRELMGLSTEQICQELAIKESNCWVILHRARLRLRSCIEQGWLTGDAI